jgi:hypothetical protein
MFPVILAVCYRDGSLVELAEPILADVACSYVSSGTEGSGFHAPLFSLACLRVRGFHFCRILLQLLSHRNSDPCIFKCVTILLLGTWELEDRILMIIT